MRRSSSFSDRQARIELLRTRAALEREALAAQLAGITRAWRPGLLLRAALAGLSVGKKGGWSALPAQVVDLVKRYPVLGSTLSSLLLGRIGSQSIVRAATIGLAGWELYKAWRGGSQPKAEADLKAPAPPTSHPPASSRPRPSE
jgi:hypothetical protein